jgi:hypothetical protein
VRLAMLVFGMVAFLLVVARNIYAGGKMRCDQYKGRPK